MCRIGSGPWFFGTWSLVGPCFAEVLGASFLVLGGCLVLGIWRWRHDAEHEPGTKAKALARNQGRKDQGPRRSTRNQAPPRTKHQEPRTKHWPGTKDERTKDPGEAPGTKHRQEPSTKNQALARNQGRKD